MVLVFVPVVSVRFEYIKFTRLMYTFARVRSNAQNRLLLQYDCFELLHFFHVWLFWSDRDAAVLPLNSSVFARANDCKEERKSLRDGR